MLKAQGYPDRKGALRETAKHIGVPERTVSRWFNLESNPPPDKIVNIKKDDIISLLIGEVHAALIEMPMARPDADYKELATTAAILIDKWQLLDGKATERKELTGKDGGAIVTKTLLSELSDDDLNRIIAGQPTTS
jgi:hypothetical protein